MKHRYQSAVVALSAVIIVSGILAAPVLAAPSTVVNSSIDTICASNPNSSICAGGANADIRNTASLNDTFASIINILLFIAGIIAVIMIIVSAIRFISSRGNPEGATKARHTLMYSIAGLVVAIIAFALVNFVLASL